VRTAGYTQVLLLGMGGSSLAPEVFRKTFGVKKGFLDLAVLDSTDPGAVHHHEKSLDLGKTLFIVSTKSGGTVETLSFFKYFYNKMIEAVGKEDAGKHFIAITDPGSKLEELASTFDFRKIFLNDPNIGGRYSALSFFGLVPAALIGVDLHSLLERAITMACNCESCNCPVNGNNLGAQLGTILGESAKAGKDKVTFIMSPSIDSFGDWVEQLIAESTGKNEKGILPVVGEPVGAPDVYGDDRLFVYLKLEDDNANDTAVDNLAKAGHPVLRVVLRDLYDLGAQIFLWEMATIVAGQRLGINPFDQPNVETAKVIAREMVTAYHKEGALPKSEPAPFDATTLKDFLSSAKPGDYFAVQAYITPTKEINAALQELRLILRDTYRLATTIGFGPRFLHSTGQLHKGDAGSGLFIQLTSTSMDDAAIPDEPDSQNSSMTFGILKTTQALGDKKALLDAGRRVVHFQLSEAVQDDIDKMKSWLT